MDFLGLYLKYKNNQEIVDLIKDYEEILDLYEEHDYTVEEVDEMIDDLRHEKNQNDKMRNVIRELYDIIDDLTKKDEEKSLRIETALEEAEDYIF